MTQIGISETAVQQLSRAFQGELLRPGDNTYDAARAVFNGMIDRRPALIARCTGAEDVVAAVNFARENDLPAAVKGGGHSVAGYSVCEDGLMIDLSLMKAMKVEPMLGPPGRRLGSRGASSMPRRRQWGSPLRAALSPAPASPG